MAYIVSDPVKYRERIYSGGAINRATLTINNFEIPNSNIKSIKLSSPIIDTTQEYFYIGTFLAQKLEIQFKNSEDIDLNGIVMLSIDTQIREPSGSIEEDDYDDGYEEVPMGQYIIDTTPEDYYQNATITCYDKSILFKKNVDISKWFDKETIIDPETGEETEKITDISAEKLLQSLCNHYLGADMLGSYPELHKNLRTGSYDNTQSGKYYISNIAEIMGCNAKMGRDGKLYLIPLKSPPAVEINALASKTWEVSGKYKISGVSYENIDGILPAGNTNDNVLFIRSDNVFLNGTMEHRQQIVNNLYEELKDFEIYTIKNENYGDPSLDAWDIIKFNLGEETYQTWNDNVLNYEMNIATTIDTKIPSKQKQNITNYVNKDSDKINRIQQVIDQINGEVRTTLTRVEDVVEDVSTNTYSKEQINQLIQNVETGITNIFSISGGNNLLTNTAPYRIISDTQLESWEGNMGSISEPLSVTKNALLLLRGIASQTVEVNSGTYAVGFKYKRLIEGATLRIIYNGREIYIDNEDNITYSSEVNLTHEGNEITSYGEVTSDIFTISFDCSTNGGFEIYELRLVHGNSAIPWTQNQNELKTKTVNIGDGIEIDSEQAKTVNRIDVDGMRVYSKTLNENTLETTDTGIVTRDIVSKGTSNISGLLIQRIGKTHIFVTGIQEE